MWELVPSASERAWRSRVPSPPVPSSPFFSCTRPVTLVHWKYSPRRAVHKRGDAPVRRPLLIAPTLVESRSSHGERLKPGETSRESSRKRIPGCGGTQLQIPGQLRFRPHARAHCSSLLRPSPIPSHRNCPFNTPLWMPNSGGAEPARASRERPLCEKSSGGFQSPSATASTSAHKYARALACR